MTNKTRQTCELFFQTFSIPVYCYSSDGSHCFHIPETEFTMDRLLSMFPAEQEQKAVIHTDRFSLFWAKILLPGYVLIIGPVSMTVFSERIRHGLMIRHFIDNRYEEELKSLLEIIPRFSLGNIISCVQVLYQLCTGSFLSAENIGLGDSLQERGAISENQLNRKVLPIFYSGADKGLELYDLSYDEEQALIQDITAGNISALMQRFTAKDAKKFGALADTTIRSTRNMFIVIIAIASRVAIRSGVSVQIAFSLSDLYIQNLETADSFENLTAIVRNAVVDYSRRIQAVKVPDGISKTVHEAMKYIEQSVNQPITVADVAEFADKSVSYFSTQFKKETGMNISTFITISKIEEAKRMLRYTESSLSSISAFLCFSSQSHFQRVFRQVAGMTPLQYRNSPDSL